MTQHESIALVDVSYAFALRWHAQTGREVSDAARETLLAIGRVRSQVSHVICCLDAPPYGRALKFPEYKAQREAPSDGQKKQKRWLYDELKRDGYQIARAESYEADDIIATLATALFPLCEDVRIVGRDKDLFQLISSRVRVFEPAVGERPETLVGPEQVRERTGVEPAQICDWLALQGDKADNIPGCPGCGPKHAARLVREYGLLEKLYEEIELFPAESESFIGKALWAKLVQSKPAVMRARELVELDKDAPIDVQALLVPLKPEPARAPEESLAEEVRDTDIAELIADRRAPPKSSPSAAEPPAEKSAPEDAPAEKTATFDSPTALTVSAPEPEYTRRLEPQTMQQAVWLAKQMEASGMFPKLRRHQEHLMVIMAGRSLGLDAVQALMSFHVLDGVPAPKWTLVQGQVQQHPDCEYFMMVESSGDGATYETKRRQNPKAQRLTYTLDQATAAGRVKPGGGWAKDPAAMCRKTAAVHLGRAVFPDLPIFGFYTAEELE